MKSRFPQLAIVLGTAFLSASSSQAGFLDLDDPTGISPATFSGVLDSISVFGSITAGFGPTKFAALVPSPSLGKSTVDDSSPQWGYPGIYTPFLPFGDRIGFESVAETGAISAHIHLAFGTPITDPLFHIAGIDYAYLDFFSNIPNGMTGLVLISGNGFPGPGGDGLEVTLAPTSALVHDFIPVTADFTLDTGFPPSLGPRSAYGTVQLLGTFTALDFDIKNDRLAGNPTIDNAAFTLSIPEPGTVSLAAIGGAGLLALRRQRKA